MLAAQTLVSLGNLGQNALHVYAKVALFNLFSTDIFFNTIPCPATLLNGVSQAHATAPSLLAIVSKISVCIKSEPSSELDRVHP